MIRARTLAGVAVATVAVLLGMSPAASADEGLTVLGTDTSAYPEIRIVVAAPAKLGDQILTDASGQVVEGGQVRAVRVMALPTDQLEVALVIDTSGSMLGVPLSSAKAAARAFLKQLPPAVTVSITSFGASSNVVGPPSSNRAAQVAAVDGLKAAGETALYDGLRTALTQLSGSGGRRMAVLLTDGGDTVSTATLDATADAFAAAKVPLFAVELRTSDSNPGALSRLTSASGGQVVSLSAPAALAGALDGVARQLARQHQITYRTQAYGETDIDVVLEAGGMRASARPHLVLPPAPAAVISPTPAQVAEGPATTSGPGRWGLMVGGGLCGTAMLGLLLALTGQQVPQARGLAVRRRGAGMSDAASWMESVGNTVLKRRGGVAAVGSALEVAGVDLRAGELLLGVATAVVAVLTVGWLLFGPLVGLGLALAVPLAARGGLHHLAHRRCRKFADQMAETLQILAGSLRAGHGLAQGIDTVGREAESPTGEEFRRLTLETRLGRDFVESLSDLADRMGGEDFRWVVQAVQIQREVGGDLAEILDTVATTMRDRTRIRRQVSALSAEGRMSAWVLMVLPFGLGGVMAVTNPGYLSPLIHSGTGLGLLAVAAALLVVGGMWLSRIVKPEF